MLEGKHIKLKYKPKNKDLDEGSSSDEDIELDDEGCQDVVRPVVVCNDPKEFIAKVMLERNLDPKTTDIKIGADDGQGLFKLNVQLLSHDGECANPGRTRYSDRGGRFWIFFKGRFFVKVGFCIILKVGFLSR